MTSAFEDGAALMARVLGAPDHQFAVIQHPIASADNDGLQARAATAVARAATILTKP